jgi:putative peptide maturation dehydrogenase
MRHVTRVKRTRHAFFYAEDDYLLDVESILRGELPALAPQGTIVALAVLTGRPHWLGAEEFQCLLSVPADRWVEASGFDTELLNNLTDHGLLLSDSDDARLRRLRARDESLSDAAWDLHSELYHYMTQWSNVTTTEPDDEADIASSRAYIAENIARYGKPPPAFPAKRQGHAVALPGRPRQGSLYQILTNRRTTRSFDEDVPMTLEQLDTVLLYVFGCHGYTSSLDQLICIKRTSPSGGCLHPNDAYLIVTNVTGIQCGIYQYCAEDHSLVLISELAAHEARSTATSFATGQYYFGAAHVSVILTARFYRNHWKYRHHHKAYTAILMDAAHLSQTLYLVSGELGLGAYVTIAINGRDIEERLGLDGVSEGVIAMAGCGPRTASLSPLEPQFSPEPPS